MAVPAFVKLPPLDGVMDHYYKVDETMNLMKVQQMKHVMKSAMSITKSKTGEVILKTNRFELAGLKRKMNVIQNQNKIAEVDINRKKIVFKAQYKKWMEYNLHRTPSDIGEVKHRYKNIRKAMQERQLTKWGDFPITQIDKSASDRESSGRQKTLQELYPYSTPAREIVSRENVSRNSRRKAIIWRESTFDMPFIRDLLTDQKLKQESIVCKKKIDNWKTEAQERQKTIAEAFKLTRTSTFVRENSASTISELTVPSGTSSPIQQRKLPQKFLMYSLDRGFSNILNKQSSNKNSGNKHLVSASAAKMITVKGDVKNVGDIFGNSGKGIMVQKNREKKTGASHLSSSNAFKDKSVSFHT